MQPRACRANYPIACRSSRSGRRRPASAPGSESNCGAAQQPLSHTSDSDGQGACIAAHEPGARGSGQPQLPMRGTECLKGTCLCNERTAICIGIHLCPATGCCVASQRWDCEKHTPFCLPRMGMCGTVWTTDAEDTVHCCGKLRCVWSAAVQCRHSVCHQHATFTTEPCIEVVYRSLGRSQYT